MAKTKINLPTTPIIVDKTNDKVEEANTEVPSEDTMTVEVLEETTAHETAESETDTADTSTPKKVLVIAETLALKEELIAFNKDENVLIIDSSEFKAYPDNKEVDILVFVSEKYVHPIDFAQTLAAVLRDTENNKVGIAGIAPYSPSSTLIFDKKNLAYYPAITAGTLAIRLDDFKQISTLEREFNEVKLCVAITALKKQCFYVRSGDKDNYKYSTTKGATVNKQTSTRCCY